jgi:Iodothyronine deiodinase
MKSNVAQDICYMQPTTFPQRVAIANDFVKRFHYPIPIAIDPMNNAADRTYGGWPERIYIIDESGIVVYRGGLGPFNYHPQEARAWLAKRFPQQSLAAVHAPAL